MNKELVYDTRGAIEGNTIECKSRVLYRMFIDDKLFISDDKQTCFESENDAWMALITSSFWKYIHKYSDFRRKLAGKEEDDILWTAKFVNDIMKNLNIHIKEYHER